MIKRTLDIIKTKMLDFLYPDLRYTTLIFNINKKRLRKRSLIKYNGLIVNSDSYMLYGKTKTKLYPKFIKNDLIFSSLDPTFLN